MNRVLVLTSVLLGLLAAAAGGQPAPGGNPLEQPSTVPDPDEIGQFFPELAAMPAPAWIKPGMRLTYLTSGGADEGDGELIPAPQGKVVEKGTGRRYIHFRPIVERDPGGGSAYTQVDVAALAGPVAVFDEGGYGLDVTTGALSLSNSTGSATNSGFNTWWVNPDALRKLADGGGGESFIVMEMPYARDGQQYQAVRIQSLGRGGSYTAWTYDLASGLLLRRVIVSDPDGIDTVDDGRFRGRRSVTVSTLKNSRQLALPWLNASPPQWVGQVNELALKGSAMFVTPGQGQTPPTPMEARFTVRARGAGWLRFHLELHEMGAAGIPMDSTAERACGTGSLAGLWIAPGALREMKVGQVIDEDPVTKVSTVVTFVGQAPDGRQATMISQISPQTRIDTAYDAETGMVKRHALTWDTPTAKNIRTVDVVGTR